MAGGPEELWDKPGGWEENRLGDTLLSDHLGDTLLSEHEKLFDSYWWQVFGAPRSLMRLLGKGISVLSLSHNIFI